MNQGPRRDLKGLTRMKADFLATTQECPQGSKKMLALAADRTLSEIILLPLIQRLPKCLGNFNLLFLRHIKKKIAYYHK